MAGRRRLVRIGYGVVISYPETERGGHLCSWLIVITYRRIWNADTRPRIFDAVFHDPPWDRR